jgi:hypothetical protein
MVANTNDGTVDSDAKVIEQYVALRRYATFADIQRDLKDAMPTHGQAEFCTPYNIVLWATMSDRLFDALTKLLLEGRIHMVPTALEHYLESGAVLNLPVVYPTEPCRYPIRHWMPTRIMPGPFRNPDGSKSELYEKILELAKAASENAGGAQ